MKPGRRILLIGPVLLSLRVGIYHVAAAYENASQIENPIENAYGQALGFANSLKNISALPPEQQRIPQSLMIRTLRNFLLTNTGFLL